MWISKIVYDRHIAKHIRHLEPNIIIGMWGSSRRTFEAGRRIGAYTILNFVNAHPLTHNERLAHFGVSGRHQEIIPRAMRAQVSAELATADLIVVPAQLVADDLYERGIDRRRILVAPYGVDADLFRSRTEETNRNARPQLIYVGQLSFRKGITVLMEVARQMPEIDFLLVGPIVSPRVLVHKPNNVKVFGAVPSQGVQVLMSNSDAFVFPTCEDTFGLVVLEAMACGLPVITTSAAGAAELVNESCGWVVDPYCPKSLYDAIKQALGQLGKLDDKSAHCRTTAMQYPWDHFTSAVSASIARAFT